MNLRAVAAIVCLFVAVSALAEHRYYRAAQTRHKDQDFVFVKVDAAFFSGNPAAEEREFTDIRACVREAHLTGHVFAVANVNRHFKFYGPKDYHEIVKYLDMNWVNARLNKELSCDF
jgi:hypothetical protein